jgi:hypothetical protein
MKKKALVMTLLCVMGLALAAGVAQATWYTCTIQQAGVLNGGYYVVWLTDINNQAAVSTPFIITNASPTLVNGMYAAALTAYANSTNVYVDLSAWADWSACTTVWAQK